MELIPRATVEREMKIQAVLFVLVGRIRKIAFA